MIGILLLIVLVVLLASMFRGSFHSWTWDPVSILLTVLVVLVFIVLLYRLAGAAPF